MASPVAEILEVPVALNGVMEGPLAEPIPRPHRYWNPQPGAQQMLPREDVQREMTPDDLLGRRVVGLHEGIHHPAVDHREYRRFNSNRFSVHLPVEA